MARLLKYLIVFAVLLALGWWIGGLPGNVVAHSGRYTVETSTPAALLILFVIALIFTVLLRIIGGLRGAPGSYGAWRGGRRKQLGEAATQRGIVALAAGDAAVAEAEALRARKHLGDTPLVLLLNAEAARLAGRAEEARAAFLQLTAHKDMAFLGHRGLLRHSMAEGDAEAAHGHALMAQDAYSGGNYVQNKRLELAVAQGDWGAALALTKAPGEVAALATAAVRAATDKRRALAFAKQAVWADGGLAPAVVALAEALRGLGKPRAARSALLRGWKTAPNPMIAESFLKPFATPIERAQQVAALAAARPGREAELVLAQTSLEANLPGEARRHAEAAMAASATDGRAQNILAALDGLAATPAATAGWECNGCHTMQVDWGPVCQHCGKIGTLRWA